MLECWASNNLDINLDLNFNYDDNCNVSLWLSIDDVSSSLRSDNERMHVHSFLAPSSFLSFPRVHGSIVASSLDYQMFICIKTFVSCGPCK